MGVVLIMITLQPNLFSLSLVLNADDKENDENYTPNEIVKPFRDLVNGFDLDPFSCDRANQIIQARNFWTKSDDAFSQDWSNYQNKWVNPPYSKGNIDRAVENVLSYAHIGNTFLLTNSNTSSKWFQDAQNYCVCYLTFNHRIEFTNPKNDGLKKDSGNAKGQTLFCFGKLTPKAFKACCKHLGNVSIVV
jgi:phage N-6-adenine-methyltransferase